MINRVAEFKSPPLIERDQLPEDMRDGNFLQKARTFMNKSEIEKRKKKEKKKKNKENDKSLNSEEFKEKNEYFSKFFLFNLF